MESVLDELSRFFGTNVQICLWSGQLDTRNEVQAFQQFS